jgi:glycosyltransferase involved in cell wall biosynthesis
MLAGVAGPSVSVIIPTHNAAAYIRDAVDSALGQTVPPLEVIVVDDGSTDGTAAVLRELGDRIRVISHRYGAAGAARNAGGAIAAGEWIAFLDADDTWLPDKLEHQLARTGDPRVGLVYTDRFNVGAIGDLPAVQSEIQPLYSGDIFLDLLLRSNRITTSSALIRTSLFRSLGGFATVLTDAEDWDLWIRLAESHRAEAIPIPLVRYRFHATNSSGNPFRMRRARRLVIDRALQLRRGASLPVTTKLRIRASMARTNGADAARRGATWLAFREFGQSALNWPFDVELYRAVGRVLLRR